jgi:cyclase
MLTKRIIPCLDVDRGRVVKGVKFFDHVDAGDPVEQAKRYQNDGADELVFYDITASFEGRQIMADLVSQVMDHVFMPLTVGGGIRTLDDATRLIQAGAEKVSLNSAAVKNPNLIAEISRKFGRCATVLGVDANRVQNDGRENWEVFINGGRVGTGIGVMDWCKKAEDLGAGEIVLNVMNADGTTAGYDLGMTAAVSDSVKIPVVASGGAGTPQHILDVLTTGQHFSFQHLFDRAGEGVSGSASGAGQVTVNWNQPMPTHSRACDNSWRLPKNGFNPVQK